MQESEKAWGASSKGWDESALLVRIGLTDLPKIGGPLALFWYFENKLFFGRIMKNNFEI